jgi:hypothetical protein
MSHEKTKYFGVGCFHFGYFPKKESKKTGVDYLQKLRSVLEGLTNTEAIEIRDHPDFKSQELVASYAGAPFGDAPDFFPTAPGNLDLEFVLAIPERVQKELGEPKSFWEPLPSERFRIVIQYGYHFPVTFVEVLDPQKECDGSDAIWMVRRFLEKEFKKLPDAEIRFEFLGPTPFHADFILEQAGEATPDSDPGPLPEFTECTRIEQRGYDLIAFRCNNENLEDAFDSLLYHIADQLQYFYYLKHTWLLRSHRWMHLSEQIQSLITRHRKEGFTALWFNTFRSGSLIHNAMISLAEFESSDIQVLQVCKSELNEFQANPWEPELQPYLEKEFDDFEVLPSEQFGRILTLLETKRSKRLNIVVTILAAILGGAVGAWITIANT